MANLTTASQVKEALRRDLKTAMKERRRADTAALRQAISALDNAEAIAVDPPTTMEASEHVVGAAQGVGASEAERKTLSKNDVIAVLTDLIDEHRSHATSFAQLGRADAAGQSQHAANLLCSYLDALKQ